jgi:photosystem II stability/assembly factor-like uncharacterized protein
MNKTIKYCIGLIFFLLGIGSAYAQWNTEKCPTASNLNSISFDGKYSAWIVGDHGTILCNTGNGWVRVNSPTSENLFSVCMTSSNNGWAVGSAGTIIRFDGSQWQTYESPSKLDLYSVSFKDPKNGIAAGAQGTVLYFENGSWRTSSNNSKGDFYAAIYGNGSMWVGGGLECVSVPIMKIENNKGEASSSLNGSFDFIYSMAFPGSDNGWAAGSPSALLHYDGREWERQVIDEKYSSLRSIFFMNETNGISVGYGGTILLFENNLWRKDYTGISRKLNGTAIWDSTYYAVGESGTIISRKMGPTTGTADEQNASAWSELQVYPNPCDDLLKCVLPADLKESPFNIILTNISGAAIFEKQYNTEIPGSEYTIVTKSIRNGLYLLHVKAGKKQYTSKILVKH